MVAIDTLHVTHCRRPGDAIHGHLVAEQEAMRRDLAHSELEHLSLAADAPLDGYLEQARRFWLA